MWVLLIIRRPTHTHPDGPARAPQGQAETGVVLTQPLLTKTMSQQAAKKIAFPAKEPTHTDLQKVLELASRLMNHNARNSGRKEGVLPSNVIAFPGAR